MAWTYSGDPSNSDLDEVRYLSGDIDEDEQLASNAEVTYCISETGNKFTAAALVCDGIAAKLAREVTITAGAGGELKLRLEQMSEAFAKRAIVLRARAAIDATPYAASVSTARKEVQEDDDDRVKPIFERDQFKNTSSVDRNVIDYDNEGLIDG